MIALLTFLPFSIKNNDPSQRWTRWNGPNPNHNTDMARAATPIPQLSEKDKTRFFAKISTEPTDKGCLLWLASTGKGYGQVRIGGRLFIATRIAYFLHYGVDPGEFHVCHKCDNPTCCGPECLYLGTQKDNMQDMMAKGRGNQPSGDKQGSRTKPECRPRGENSWCAKLTEADIPVIRADPRTHRVIAAEYGVHYSVINCVKQRKTWKGVA